LLLLLIHLYASMILILRQCFAKLNSKANSDYFDIDKYSRALGKELSAFGFDVQVEKKNKAVTTVVQSAFLKANTFNELLVITPDASIARDVPRGQLLKIKLEVDTYPPPGLFSGQKFSFAYIIHNNLYMIEMTLCGVYRCIQGYYGL